MRIIPYQRASGLSPLIRDYLALGEAVRFIVPSRKDREWWHQRAGTAFQPPFDAPAGTQPQGYELWNWQDLCDDIRASCGARRLRPISPPDHRLILRHILSGTLDAEPELLELWPGLARDGFLDILSNDIHEMLNEAVAPEQLAPPPDAPPTARLLPRVFRRYLDYLSASGLMDSAQVCSAALEALKPDWGRGLTLVFTGFLSFTHSQLELVKRLDDLCGEVVVLKPEAGLDDFYDASRQLADRTWSETPPELPGRVLQMPSSEREMEPEAVARALALWRGGEGPLAEEMEFPGFSAIGIMSPDTEIMSEALTRFGIPFSPDSGTAISETLPGRILSGIRTLQAQDFPTGETALLLTRPCFAGVRFPVAAALKAGPSGLGQWEEYLAASEDPIHRAALDSVRAIGKFCRAVSRGGTPAKLMEAFYRFLTAKGLWLERLPSTAYPELDGFIRTTASAIETVKEKYLGLKELLPDIGDIGRVPLKGEGALEFLETWCQESRTRPPLPLLDAVRLYSGPPPVLSSYPVWILLDVVQKNWPGRIPGSPLLGAGELDRLAQNGAWLPSPQDKALQKEALFRRLLQTGESLTLLSRAESDEEGHPLAESPFTARFIRDMRGWSLRNLPPEPISILLDAPAPLSLEGPQPRVTPAIEDAGPFTLGVSDLKELLTCPLRWWLQRRARLRERITGLATSADWGSLAHLLWERVWRRFARDGFQDGPAPFTQIVAGEWEALGSEGTEFDRLLQDRRLARWREIVRSRVFRLGEVQARILARMQQRGIRHVAVWLEGDAALDCELDGVPFVGRCDRVEVLADPSGRLQAIIMDYKNGNAAGYETGLRNIGDRPWNPEGRGASPTACSSPPMP